MKLWQLRPHTCLLGLIALWAGLLPSVDTFGLQLEASREELKVFAPIKYAPEIPTEEKGYAPLPFAALAGELSQGVLAKLPSDDWAWHRRISLAQAIAGAQGLSRRTLLANGAVVLLFVFLYRARATIWSLRKGKPALQSGAEGAAAENVFKPETQVEEGGENQADGTKRPEAHTRVVRDPRFLYAESQMGGTIARTAVKPDAGHEPGIFARCSQPLLGSLRCFVAAGVSAVLCPARRKVPSEAESQEDRA